MKKILVNLALVMVLIFASACGKVGGQEVEKENVQLLLGIRNNSKAPDLKKAEEEIKSALKSQGNLGLTLIDGSPKLVKSFESPKPKAMLSPSKKQDILNTQFEEINTFIGGLRPQAPECDILKAINISADNLADRSGVKSLVIMDSGLSTTGLLDFRSADVASLKIDEIIGALQSKKAIPNLEGVDVSWYGMGQTTDPQIEPSSEYKYVLEELWTAILKEAGAKSVHIAREILEDVELDRSDFPKVSPVDCKLEESIIASLDEPMVFGQEKIKFKSDSAELLTNKKDVEARLKPIVDFMNENSQEKILLAGTTAKYGSQKSCEDLSLKRCETIKTILVSMGIEEARIRLLGLGYENPFYQNDLKADGSQDEVLAVKNRTVIVMSLKSQTAKDLLGERN